MTENEALYILNNYNFNMRQNGAFDMITAISVVTNALKGIQQYREIGTVEECKEMAVIANKKTNPDELAKIIVEWIQYNKIGTVEECREAVDKKNAKKCVIDSCPDHTHYKCPSCGKIHLSRYKHGCPSLGRIPRFCEYCGQAIDENLEGMEDE